ncbi:MAG: ImmA/IrrE family metallo-endopeptidase [Bacteroidales bacterium]|nr:ImmA/IrrE family metallo-endopeptidase [Bacteroidales bacterium]
MKEIKPVRLTWQRIRQIVEEFRGKHVDPVDLIPVPINDIIEFKLGLDIQPIFGLKEQIDTEGFLQSNLTTISVDSKSYVDDRYKFRLNFTLAHEVGHLVLHAEQYKEMQFTSTKEFIQFQQNIDEDSLEWFEKQANEFAGRLLVPIDKLKELVSAEEAFCTQLADKLAASSEEISGREIESYVLDSLAGRIYKVFEVSKEVVKRRIRTENLKHDFGFIDLASKNDS